MPGPGCTPRPGCGSYNRTRRTSRVTTLLAFAFVLGVLVFVHELGHFMAARWNGVRVLTFSLGFGPKLLKFRRGDTEYCLSADPARRLRQDGRREPRGSAIRPAGRVPVQEQMAAVPDSDHGPGDEPRPGGRRPGRGADAGRDGARLHGPAGARRCRAGRLAGRAGRRPARRHHHAARVRGHRHVGTAGDGGGLAARARGRDGGDPRIGREQRLTIRPDTTELRTRSDARFEVGTIGVLPDVNPSIRALVAGEPAETGRASSPAT